MADMGREADAKPPPCSSAAINASCEMFRLPYSRIQVGGVEAALFLLG